MNVLVHVTFLNLSHFFISNAGFITIAKESKYAPVKEECGPWRGGAKEELDG